MKKQTIFLTLLFVVIIGVLGWALLSSKSDDKNAIDNTQTEIVNDPIDVTMELYAPWLAYLQSTSTELSQTEILEIAPITEDLRARLTKALNDSLKTIDPIMCQTVLPERIGVKIVFINDTQAQLSVVARGNKVPEQALVTLEVINNGWVISDIACSQGEVGPNLEFSFVNDGNLLKQSLQPPLDSQKWHLVYTLGGVSGHTIPLIFDSLSVCIEKDGSEQTCSDDKFSETAKVSIKGEMQEAGVLIRRMEMK